MRSLAIARVLLGVVLGGGGCVLVERPPARWPQPDPGTPPIHAERVGQCRAMAMQRGAKANHAIRAQTVLVWAGSASLAGGAVTATLAGLDTPQREGVIGAAVVTTVSAGIALGARFVASPDEERERYEATRAHEHAAVQGLWRLAEVSSMIMARRRSPEVDAPGPALPELLGYEAELRELVAQELSRCISVDPRVPPLPIPELPGSP